MVRIISIDRDWGVQLWHTFITNDMLDFAAKHKTPIPVVSLIQSYTAKYICPRFKFTVFRYDRAVNKLGFQDWLFCNKLGIRMLGVILKFSIK